MSKETHETGAAPCRGKIRRRRRNGAGHVKLGLLIAVLATVLGGCSVVPVGEAEFSCPGTGPGVRCASAREVYEMTNTRERLETQRTGTGEATTAPAPRQSAAPAPVPAPRIDGPVPVRAPAVVMRVWVAPWEDQVGDLMAAGYVYTEIEPRRWAVGLRHERSRDLLKPLASPTRP